MQIKEPVILFDGKCNLCNGAVDFLLKHDREKQFRFISLQSESGEWLIQKFQIPINIDSIIFIKINKVYFKSDAIIEILGMLTYPWKIGIIAKYIPKIIRDRLYQMIAKNRYRWFGKKEICRNTTSDETEIFRG